MMILSERVRRNCKAVTDGDYRLACDDVHLALVSCPLMLSAWPRKQRTGGALWWRQREFHITADKLTQSHLCLLFT